MKRIFADTGYYIAVLNPKDELHQKSIYLTNNNIGFFHIFTSEMVLGEVLNGFSKMGPRFRQLASASIEALYSHRDVTVIQQSSSQFQKGLLLYKQRLDKDWSITDCVSFKIMEENGITEALAYDKHFEQAGFTALLRD